MDSTTIIFGYVSCKSANKFLARFQRRYVVLVFVHCSSRNRKMKRLISKKMESDIEGGYYELRFFRSKKSTKLLFSYVINPKSMICSTCKIKKSGKFQFGFFCSSNAHSMLFSTCTAIERDAWLSVLQQLQWQYNPQKCNSPNSESSAFTISTASHSSRESLEERERDETEKKKEPEQSQKKWFGFEIQIPKKKKETPVYVCKRNAQMKSVRDEYQHGNLWRKTDLNTVSNTKSPCDCVNCYKNKRTTILDLLNTPESSIAENQPDYDYHEHEHEHEHNVVKFRPVPILIGIDEKAKNNPDSNNNNNKNNSNNNLGFLFSPRYNSVSNTPVSSVLTVIDD